MDERHGELDSFAAARDERKRLVRAVGEAVPFEYGGSHRRILWLFDCHLEEVYGNRRYFRITLNPYRFE